MIFDGDGLIEVFSGSVDPFFKNKNGLNYMGIDSDLRLTSWVFSEGISILKRCKYVEVNATCT